MLSQQTREQLRTLNLHGMLQALEAQQAQPDVLQMTFEERLALIVDQEYLARSNRALQNRLRKARLKMDACLENIDYQHPRGLTRGHVQPFASTAWLQQHLNCIITGPTGAGKTFIGCAIAQRACRFGFRTRYYSAPKLFRDLACSRADGSTSALLASIAKAQLLVIDDWGIERLDDLHARDMLEILEDRTGSASTLITSQLPTSHWHEAIGNPTVADAILDRLIHAAHHITLKGESLRKHAARKEAKT